MKSVVELCSVCMRSAQPFGKDTTGQRLVALHFHFWSVVSRE